MDIVGYPVKTIWTILDGFSKIVVSYKIHLRISDSLAIIDHMSAAPTTTSDMARKKKEDASSSDEHKKPTEVRPPSWVVYARLEQELEAIFEDYQAKFEYPPPLARVIEKALKKLFADAGVYPARKKNGHH